VNAPTRLAGFAAVAAVVLGLALLLGRAVGPVDADPVAHDGDHSTPGAAEPVALPGGLMVSQDGYTLELGADRAEAGADVPVSFTITGPDGEPVTAYDVQHEKQLHLIAVRRDFTGFQHVHPTLADGVWSVDLALTPGTWRLFADFKASDGDALTLGADLTVAGEQEPAPGTGERRTATVDGYEVTLEGDLSAGADARLTLGVSKDGDPVTNLQPHLGAYGHLVALRDGDLAYLHVHPDGEPGDGTTAPGPDIVFHTAVPSVGTYHLYLDFRHDGVVRTADFTVTVGAGDDTRPDTDGEHAEEESDDHAH
jgi:hypothetical protein